MRRKLKGTSINSRRRLRATFSAGSSSPKSLKCAAFLRPWAPRSNEKCEPNPPTSINRGALKRRSGTFTRGDALPETALVISVVLLVFLGVIQLAQVGYQQSESDAAAFVAAHEGSFGSNPANQKTYGQNTAYGVFKDFPSNGTSGIIKVLPATSNTPNPSGNLVGYANRVLSGGIFFVKPGAQFNLHSFFIEPVATSGQYSAGASSLQIVTANPPNCTTHNTATTSCPGMIATMATPNPSNTTDPYYTYACHAIYYAVLSNSSGFYPNPNTYFAPQTQDMFSQASGSAVNYVLPDNASLAGLTNGNQPWPRDFQPTAFDGVNNPSLRASGTWLTTQIGPNGPDPANADGQATSGGTLGTALQPLFNFGGGGTC
jgi:TadE-like protein